MATNYRQAGNHVDVNIATAPVTSGKETRNAGILGVPLSHGLVGQTVAFAVAGVYALTVSIGGTLGVGTFLFWDTSAAALSIGYASDDPEFGQIVEVLDSTNKVYAVRLSNARAPRGQSQWPA